MTQANPIITSGKTGIEYRTEDNNGKQALLNHHKGAAAPGYKEAGTLWLDDAATPWVLKIYDGTDWINIADIHATNNTCTLYNGAAQISQADFTVTTAGSPAVTVKSSDITTGNKGSLKLNSNNSAATEKTFAEIQANVATASTSAEDGVLNLKTMRAGTLADRLKIGSGIYTPGSSDSGANTISAVLMQADAYRSKSVTLNDDTATSFTPGIVNGHLTAVVDGGGTTQRLMAAFSTTSPFCSAIAFGTAFATTVGALAGTTSTDGKIIVSVHTDGKIYIENRSGAAQTIRVTVF